jgi:hypothetical protein
VASGTTIAGVQTVGADGVVTNAILSGTLDVYHSATGTSSAPHAECIRHRHRHDRVGKRRPASPVFSRSNQKVSRATPRRRRRRARYFAGSLGVSAAVPPSGGIKTVRRRWPTQRRRDQPFTSCDGRNGWRRHGHAGSLPRRSRCHGGRQPPLTTLSGSSATEGVYGQESRASLYTGGQQFVDSGGFTTGTLLGYGGHEIVVVGSTAIDISTTGSASEVDVYGSASGTLINSRHRTGLWRRQGRQHRRRR